MHVVVDATGLKVYGAGEWLVEKHGERGEWIWRKLHLAVNSSTVEVLASVLSCNEDGNASQIGCSVVNRMTSLGTPVSQRIC